MDKCIYIGYDPREEDAYQTLVYSIQKNLSEPIPIRKVEQSVLRRVGMYRRGERYYRNMFEGRQGYDMFDGKPFSTEFSFSRFLVPHLNLYTGQALFMDCDMLVLGDLNEVFHRFKDSRAAVHVVKHDHKVQDNSKKMDEQVQSKYWRKNWSSVVLWNCEHPKHLNLTVDDVNTKSGQWLHGFQWLHDDDIYGMPDDFNWLVGYSSHYGRDPVIVHFTEGGPWFNNWDPHRKEDADYGKLWEKNWAEMNVKNNIEGN